MSENKTAEEFTKEVSSDEHGLRGKLKESGDLKHVHSWIDRFANQQNQELQRQVESLMQVIESCDQTKQALINKYTQIKDAADEMAKIMEDLSIYVLNATALNWLNNSLENYKQLTTKQNG